MNKFKYIAALEISSEEVRFGVSRISFPTSSFMVVHKARFQGSWFTGEKLANKDAIISLVRRSIIEFESRFRTKLESISLVVPDFSSRMQQAYENINFSERKNITVNDFEKLTIKVKDKFTNDREIAIKAQSRGIQIDGTPVQNPRNFLKIGSQIASNYFVSIIRRDILEDHGSIIKGCEKKIGMVRTTSMAHSEVLMSENKSGTSVIVNWMNKKVVLSIYVNGVLYKVTEFAQGVDNIAEMISKKNSGVRIDFIKNYMYQMLEVNREFALDDKVVMRRGKNDNKVEITSAELKKLVTHYLGYIVQEIEKILMRYGLNLTTVKMHHVGKISKIARYDEIIRSCSNFKESLVFTKLDVFGANENWTQIIVGMMLLDVKKVIGEIRAQQNKIQMEEMMKQRAYNSPQFQKPMPQQQRGYYQSQVAAPQMNMRAAQKTFIK